MIDLFKLLLSKRGLQSLALFWGLSMLLSLRYWVKYYNQFSIDLFQFASSADLLGLSLSRFMYAATALLVGSGLLAGALFRIWARNGNSNPTVDGVFLLVGFLTLVFVPPFAIDQAAKNDAQVVQGGKPSMLFSTIQASAGVSVETKDGRTLTGYRWIGATSDYLILWGPDSNCRILRRDEAKLVDFH
jgi:hypothetical protein